LTLEEKLNTYGGQREPFFFCISYDLTQWEVVKLSQLPKNIKFELDINKKSLHQTDLKTTFIKKEDYKNKFNKIQKEILSGNTYLANLTTSTKLNTTKSLEELYNLANGKFKLFYRDKFICFSPERFIECKDNKMLTYPMKGTIDANISNAKQKILEDSKELAEHTMVVDLLRNDLSIVASSVKVDNFRYCETIKAGDKQLIQVSSQISGKLEDNWQDNIGYILTSLLPAGSITGAPKKKTIEIIDEVEGYKRGFFTGIFGVFDGENLDSAVMIRFIQKDESGKLVYKSGGGITSDSDLEKEYQEMIDKVYVP